MKDEELMKLAEETVTVIHSTCPRCNNTVNAGLKTVMESYHPLLEDFHKEAKTYKLIVKETTLKEWRAYIRLWCCCKVEAKRNAEKYGI